MSFLEDVMLSAVIGGGSAWAVVRYLSKKFIEQQLQKDIENHKQQLTEKTEGLKHSLSIYAHEKNIQASRVDAQLSSAINKVYSSFVKLMQYAEKFSNEEPPIADPIDVAENKDSQEACEYRFYKNYAEKVEEHSEILGTVLLENAIYLDSKTYNIISHIQQKFSFLSNEFLRPIREEENGRDDIEEIVAGLLKLKKELSDYYNIDLVKSKEIILSTFREQLGVEKI
jgi:hypothetical protein